MVIPRFVGRALADEPLEVHGDGLQTRCFCHVQDTIRAVYGLHGAPRTSPARSSTSDPPSACASSTSHSAYSTSLSRGPTSRSIPHDQVYGLGIEDVLHREPSIEKINSAIGWQPTRTLDEILRDVVEHARATVVA